MTKVLYIHKGDPSFLAISAAQAFEIGLTPVIIGDEAARCSPYEFIDIKEFLDAASVFRDAYIHRGVNTYDYEIFCFERWFIAQKYIENNREDILMIDHDILLYPKILDFIKFNKLVQKTRITLMDSAWINHIPNYEGIKIITDYFIKIFVDEKEAEKLAITHAIGNTPHLSDMHLLLELSSSKKEIFLETATKGCDIGIDNNIRLRNDFMMINDHKFVAWRGRLPYLVRNDGTEQELCCLHFQGPSKYLMDLMHTISDQNKLLTMPSFSYQVDNIPHDHLGNMIRLQRHFLTKGKYNLKSNVNQII